MADRENLLEIPLNCLKKLGSGVKIWGRSGNLKHTTFYFRPKLNVEALSCTLLGLMSLSTIFQSSQGSVFGCDRGLNTQFNSTASLWYQVPDTLLDSTSSHIILTQYTVTEATIPSPTQKI